MMRMNLSARWPNTRHGKHVLARALTFSMLLVLPSCAIPPLRLGEPAPGLPPTFNGVASRYLAGAAQQPGRGHPALPGRRGEAELLRDPPGGRRCRQLLHTDGARQAVREPGPNHQASAGKPPDF